MCLRPIKVRSPTNHIDPAGGQQLQMTVQCNQCAECIENKRQEWMFRAYHQVKNCLSAGGYVLYDTLTYSEEFVPHLSDFIDLKEYTVHDFTCFNHVHFKNFLKNLRRQLSYHYKNKVSFKYFLTSEYGTDERYTHRPHHHFLLYVYGNIHPYALSKLISKVWTYGRTDGLPYKTRRYVADNVFGYDLGFGLNNDFHAQTKVCNYVAKYISKDSTFQSELDKRIAVLEKFIDDEDILRSLKRNISLFHRQSQGFGLSYLDNITDDMLKEFDDNICTIRDSEKVVRTLPLPMYYKRHLYYTMKKDDEDKRFWQLTDDGISHYINSMTKSVDKIEKRFNDVILNASDDDREHVSRLLSDRTLHDFCVYKVFYKGRLRDKHSYSLQRFSSKSNLTADELEPSTWLNSIYNSMYYRTNPTTLQRTDDYVYIPRPGVQYDLFDNTNSKYDTIDYNKFIRTFTFNQNSAPYFRDFDVLDSLFEYIVRPQNERKQTTFDYIETLTKKFKVLYG